MKLAPMPSTLCGPGLTAAQHRSLGFHSAGQNLRQTLFQKRATPVKVPAVPEPMTSASMRPSICSKISWAVVW